MLSSCLVSMAVLPPGCSITFRVICGISLENLLLHHSGVPRCLSTRCPISRTRSDILLVCVPMMQWELGAYCRARDQQIQAAGLKQCHSLRTRYVALMISSPLVAGHHPQGWQQVSPPRQRESPSLCPHSWGYWLPPLPHLQWDVVLHALLSTSSCLQWAQCRNPLAQMGFRLCLLYRTQTKNAQHRYPWCLLSGLATSALPCNWFWSVTC